MSMMMRLGPNSIALRSAAGMLSSISQGLGDETDQSPNAKEDEIEKHEQMKKMFNKTEYMK